MESSELYKLNKDMLIKLILTINKKNLRERKQIIQDYLNCGESSESMCDHKNCDNLCSPFWGDISLKIKMCYCVRCKFRGCKEHFGNWRTCPVCKNNYCGNCRQYINECTHPF